VDFKFFGYQQLIENTPYLRWRKTAGAVAAAEQPNERAAPRHRGGTMLWNVFVRFAFGSR
jgi:hypothetical protein